MRIVLVTPGVRGLGSYCINLFNQLKKSGHEVLLISQVKWHKQQVANIQEVDSVLLFGLIPCVYKPHQIEDKIKAFKPDIIHYHWPSGSMDYMLGGIYKLGIPVVVTLHVAIGSTRFMFDKVWYAHFTALKGYLRRSAAVISISKFVAEQVDRRLTLGKDRHVLLYAGVDQAVFKPSKKKASGPLKLIFVGQIMPEKGIDVLIDAVRQINKSQRMELSIIGRGHLESRLRHETANEDFIKWIGFLPQQKDIAEHYAGSDVTVLPTRWDEAFSLVPIESLSCGTPVIATAKGGTPEIIDDGKTGFLLKECDRELLVKMLLSLDRKRLSRMRPACRELIQSKFNIGKMGREHEALYKRILSRRSEPSEPLLRVRKSS
jgi:glycosyltransferase involved in cell wall biosynthesis